MKKQLLSILLCLIMVVGLLPTAALAEEAAPAFDKPAFDLTRDLEDITIPNDLVTCICTTTGESRSYGELPDGFSASEKIEKEDGVWTVIISVGMPHVCGDEPRSAGDLSIFAMYAPRMWG